MRAQTDLKGFFKIFFAKLNAYRDVKQGYDDLGSVLSSQQRDKDGDFSVARPREERSYVKREAYSNQAKTDHRQQEEQRIDQRERKVLRPPGYEANKRLWTPDRERRDFRPRMLQHMRGVDEEPEFRGTPKDDWVQNFAQRVSDGDQQEEFASEEQPQEEEVDLINAMDREKGDKKRGCFWKYMYGECTNKECTMDHRDETIQGMWKKRVWDLAKAAKGPGGDILVAELQRALRDAQASSNSNTRA